MSNAFQGEAYNVPRPIRLGDDRSFWHQGDPEFDPKTRRIIKGGFWSHQREIWALDNYCKLLVGGYGSGKTNIGGKWIISSALENAPAPVAAISPSFPVARETTIATIIELLDGKKSHYGRKLGWTYNKSTHVFTIRLKGRTARIIVYSGDNPLSLRGPNLGSAWIDEPFIQHEDVFKQMIARVRSPLAVNRQILLTGTPEQLNWGYDLAMGEVDDGSGKQMLDVGVVFASTRANKALPPDFVRNLEASMTEKAAKAYIDGQFVNLSEGMVYYGFDPTENLVDLEVPAGAELIAGMDFNVNPMAAVVLFRNGDHIHVLKEYELPNSDTEYMCQTLREDWGDTLHDIYPDASGRARHTNAPGGKSDFHYIRDAGFEVFAPRANPKHKDRYNAVNGKFKARDGRVTLTVSPKCRKLKKYLQVYSHEMMLKQKDMSHLLDALGYPISALYGSHRNRTESGNLVGA